MDRRRFTLGLLAVVSLALAMRALPLYWSPYPATQDGYGYVANAQATITGGSIPLDGFRAEDFVFTILPVVGSRVLGMDPLFVLQPLMVPVGATAVLAGVALVHRCCRGLFSRQTVRLAALLAGILFAVSGIYLRRTLVPDSDILAHVFLPLLAVVWYRFLQTARPAWAGVAGVFLVSFPLVHTLSTLLAALTVTGVTVAVLVGRMQWRRIAISTVTVAAFWVYVAGYYTFAGAHPLLTVSYVDRVTAHPGLFLAWLLVLLLGIPWFATTSSRLRQTVVAAPFVIAFLALAANQVTTVFPGTIPTPPGLLALMSLNLVMIIFAVRVWKVVPASEMILVVVALLAAPVVAMYFALTASLGPRYFAMALRSHTFIYLPLLALAAIAVATIVTGASGSVGWLPSLQESAVRSGLKGSLVVVLLVSMVGTAPLAYLHLDTMTFPQSTTHGEFRATTFTAQYTTGSWASSGIHNRVGKDLYDRGGTNAPIWQWLNGGPSPDQPMLSRESWISHGAAFWPSAPRTISADRYNAAIQCRNLVYGTTTRNSLDLSLPSNETSPGC